MKERLGSDVDVKAWVEIVSNEQYVIENTHCRPEIRLAL